MTTLLAVIRPDEWNFPLFLHVLGAMILVGGLLASASTLAFAGRDPGFLRLGYRSLLAVAFPAYVLMRIGAQWTYSKEGLDDVDDEPTWIDIGYATADVGALILLLALILGGIGVYRLRTGRGERLLRITMALSVLLLAAYLVTAWAMTAKPD